MPSIAVINDIFAAPETAITSCRITVVDPGGLGYRQHHEKDHFRVYSYKIAQGVYRRSYHGSGDAPGIPGEEKVKCARSRSRWAQQQACWRSDYQPGQPGRLRLPPAARCTYPIWRSTEWTPRAARRGTATSTPPSPRSAPAAPWSSAPAPTTSR